MCRLTEKLLALSLIGLSGCTAWPQAGEGGLAELYQSAMLPVEVDTKPSSLQLLRLDLNHSQRLLDILILQGAERCFPATTHLSRLLEFRIIRELEGGLFDDAEVDLISHRQQLNQLELKLDLLGSRTDCNSQLSVPDVSENLSESETTIDHQSLMQLLNSDNQFAINSDQINPKYASNLLTACNHLKDNKKYHLYITGHTDITGNDVFNNQLSARRASAVVTFFQHCQLDNSRLHLFSKGETSPLFNGASTDILLINRRVNIQLIEVKQSQGAL